MTRQYVVRYRRKEKGNGSQRPAGETRRVVVAAENIPMAMREFYQEHADCRHDISLVEIYETAVRNNHPGLLLAGCSSMKAGGKNG